MSEPLRGVVVGHGEVAAALVGAVEQISGIRGVLTAVTNSGADRDTLEARVLAAVGTDPAVIFVDLASGSCMIAALRKLKARDDVRVVTGVNLAMLLDFAFHREGTADEAARRAAATGERAILVP